MLSTINQKINLYQNEEVLTAKSGTHEKIRSPFSFDSEFSLPPYFFDKDFLDNADLCEPHVNERMQPENDLLLKRTGLPEKSQEYKCWPQALVTIQQWSPCAVPLSLSFIFLSCFVYMRQLNLAPC